MSIPPLFVYHPTNPGYMLNSKYKTLSVGTLFPLIEKWYKNPKNAFLSFWIEDTQYFYANTHKMLHKYINSSLEHITESDFLKDLINWKEEA